jgi:hypothetical protein
MIKKKSLLILLIITTGIIFLGRSLYNANLINSLDFRTVYDLAKLFFEKSDIFEFYLVQQNVNPFWGKWGNDFIHNNEMPPPQWGHILYFFLFPYVLLPYQIAHIIWFISNLVFLYFIIKIIKKNYNLSFDQLSILIIMIISSTPLTNTLGNGQFGLLLLLILLIYWHHKKKIYFGFLSIKITASAFFILYSFLKRDMSFIYFAIIYLIGIISYCYYLNDFNFNNLTNQIQVLLFVNNMANESVAYNGIANLRVVLKIIKIEQYYNLILILFVLLVSFFILKKKNFNYYNKENFLILNNLNLLTFYHAIYDFIFLIPLLAYTLTEKLNFRRKFTFYFTVIYFFYLIKINRSILNNLLHEDIIHLIGFGILIYTSLLLYRIKNYL